MLARIQSDHRYHGVHEDGEILIKQLEEHLQKVGILSLFAAAWSGSSARLAQSIIFIFLKLFVPWNLWVAANLNDSNSINQSLSTSNILVTKASLDDSWSMIHRACICMQLRAMHCIRTCSIHAPGIHTRVLACARALTHTIIYIQIQIDKGSNERAVAPFTQLEIQDTHAQLSSGFKTKTTVRTDYGSHKFWRIVL